MGIKTEGLDGLVIVRSLALTKSSRALGDSEESWHKKNERGEKEEK